jgi:hypothetical protein
MFGSAMAGAAATACVMETSRSPRELRHRAFELGKRLWQDHACDCSRHDFTQPQLFACLVLRESMRMSYHKAEAFLG